MRRRQSIKALRELLLGLMAAHAGMGSFAPLRMTGSSCLPFVGIVFHGLVAFAVADEDEAYGH